MSNAVISYLLWKVKSPVAAETGYIHRQNSDIHYVVYGRGIPVVLLHGGLSNKLSWFSQLPMLVESGHQVILLDTRGHGKSTRGDVEPSYHVYARDVIGVLDTLKIGVADLLGWSDGGNTALVLGYEYPQRVRRIIAISANFHPMGLTKQAQQDNRKPYNRLRQWFNRHWTQADHEYPQLELQIKKLWDTSPRLTPDKLAGIPHPVLIIVGENDYVSVEHAKTMTDAMPDATLKIIKGAGHNTPITHAGELNQLIAGFLSEQNL